MSEAAREAGTWRTTWKGCEDLRAMGTAMAIIAALLAAIYIYGERLERHSIHQVAWELAHEKDPETEPVPGMDRLERIKNQGMSLQRRALLQPDLVSLYGSSELRKMIPDKAGIFFSRYPTGFGVFQIGKAGTTSLVLLQKIAAAMPPNGPRHLALSLSSTWFLGAVQPHYYEGNFSRQQALAVVFDHRLSFGLKRDLARRMLQFPNTVARDSLLESTLPLLARSTLWDRFLYLLAQPLGALQNAVYAAQDHFETALYVLQQKALWPAEIPREEKALNWPALLDEVTKETAPLEKLPVSAADRHVLGDDSYRELLARSPEWDDLELLLRTCRELGVEPLLLSMPPNGEHYRRLGVSRAALAEYSRRLHELCGRYGVRLETFDDHVEDRAFVVDSRDHMSVKGWMYYNQMLDDYFHRRHRR